MLENPLNVTSLLALFLFKGELMKKIIILASLILSTQTFASATTSNLLAYTLAEAIYTTAIPIGTTGALSASTKEAQKEAVQLKSDVQEYYQSGLLCASLQSKVAVAQEIDSSLSLDESLDALVDAANIILN